MNTKRAAPTELRPTIRRLEAFSDAVFAIILTIMVLEVELPESLASADGPAALENFAMALGAYMLSFVVIANLWTSHHYLVFTIERPTRSTIWFNNLLLFCASLLPVATRLLGKYPEAARAAAIYGLVAVASTLSFMLLRSHAARITHNELHRSIHRLVIHRTRIILVVFTTSIPLAFINAWLAWSCFVIAQALFFLPIIRRPLPATHGTTEDRALEQACP